MDDDISALVIDNGTGMIKFFFVHGSGVEKLVKITFVKVCAKRDSQAKMLHVLFSHP